MKQYISLIGFGEAGFTFAATGHWGGRVRAFDIKTEDPNHSAAMAAAYGKAGVTGDASLPDAVRPARLVLSMVTADRALEVAQGAARHLGPDAIYCDFNSVAPNTKQAAASAIENAGGRYIDVAVMSPVGKLGLATPLLLSGPAASEAVRELSGLGFSNMREVGLDVGKASSIKMIRSVMIKGMEALTAECLLAADAAGVLDEIIASLNGTEMTTDWRKQGDYNLERMLVHGLRRSAEMREVVKTLVTLRTSHKMALATADVQHALGALGVTAAPDGLAAKLVCAQTAVRRPT